MKIELVNEKGYEYVTVPEEYIKRGKRKEPDKEALIKGIAKAGAFFAKKENWMNMLEVAGAIVGLAIKIKGLGDKK